jgi:hypothetical protein
MGCCGRWAWGHEGGTLVRGEEQSVEVGQPPGSGAVEENHRAGISPAIHRREVQLLEIDWPSGLAGEEGDHGTIVSHPLAGGKLLHVELYRPPRSRMPPRGMTIGKSTMFRPNHGFGLKK